MAQDIHDSVCVDTPTVRRAKGSDKMDRLSVQWYGVVHGYQIPGRQFQFPLHLDLRSGFMHFHPDHYEIIFFGCADDWSSAPTDSSAEQIRCRLLRLADNDASRPLLVAYSPYLGMNAASLTMELEHDGGIVWPKPYERMTCSHVDYMLTEGAGHVWVRASSSAPPASSESARVWTLKAS